jgi:hypothetical protein
MIKIGIIFIGDIMDLQGLLRRRMGNSPEIRKLKNGKLPMPA